MATQSLSKNPPPVRDIERELKYAKSKLNDAVWEEDEELQKALKRQIVRLEILRELARHSANASQEASQLGERYDVDF